MWRGVEREQQRGNRQNKRGSREVKERVRGESGRVRMKGSGENREICKKGEKARKQGQTVILQLLCKWREHSFTDHLRWSTAWWG